MKYEIGDKVLIRKDLHNRGIYGGASWISCMGSGEIVTIHRIDKNHSNWFYATDNPDDGLDYSFEMIEKIIVKNEHESRLDILKREREIIKGLKTLSFGLKDDCDKWYKHEIECIENTGQLHPIIEDALKGIRP